MSAKSRKILKITGFTLGGLLALITLLLLFAGSSWGQTFIVKRLISNYSKKMEINAHVNKVHFRLANNELSIDGLFISDQQKNTLLYAKSILVDVDVINKKKINISKVVLDEAEVNLRTYAGDSTMNFAPIIDYFSTAPTTDSTPSEFPEIHIASVELHRAKFALHDQNNSKDETLNRMNFNNLALSNLDLSIENAIIAKKGVTAEIKGLSVSEKSGFLLKNFSAWASYVNDVAALSKADIRTAKSHIKMDASLNLGNPQAFSGEIQELEGSVNISDAHLDLSELAYFSDELKKINDIIDLRINASGKLGNMIVKDFLLRTGKETQIGGNLSIKGLPDLLNAELHFKTSHSFVSLQDIEKLSFLATRQTKLPDALHQLNRVSLKGNLDGSIHDMQASLELNSECGNIQTNLKLSSDKNFENPTYQGSVKAKDFFLAKLLQDSMLPSRLDLTLALDGKHFNLDELSAKLEGDIDHIHYKDYVINHIELNADIDKKLMFADIALYDPIGDFDLKGSLDLRTKNAEKLEANGFVKDINLTKLGLLNDSMNIYLSSFLDAELTGFNLQQPEGKLTLSNTGLIRDSRLYKMNSFEMTLENNGGNQNEAGIHCDYLTANLGGNFYYDQLPYIFDHLKEKYMPEVFLVDLLYEQQEDEITKEQQPATDEQPHIPEMDIVFDIKVLQVSGLLNFFVNNLNVALGTTIEGDFLSSAGSSSLTVIGNSKRIEWNNMLINDLDFRGKTAHDALRIQTEMSSVSLNDNSSFSDFKFSSEISKGNVNWAVQWDTTAELPCKADFSGYFNIPNKEVFEFHIDQSKLTVNNDNWFIDPDNLVSITKDNMDIQKFNLFTNNDTLQQAVNIDGMIGSYNIHPLNIDFKNLQLSSFEWLISSIGMKLDGVLDGTVEIHDFSNFTNISSGLRISELAINDSCYGDMKIATQHDEQKGALEVDIRLINDSIGLIDPTTLWVNGYYQPKNKAKPFDFALNFNQFDLAILKEYVSSFTSELTGKVSGKAGFTWTPQGPDLNGKLTTIGASIKIDYLNTTYLLEETAIGVSLNELVFDQIGITDNIYQTSGVLNGILEHKNFNDFKLNLKINSDRLLALNTTYIDNDLFYGTAFISGDIAIIGPADHIVIDVGVRTEKGTTVTVPLESRVTIKDSDFIHFVQRNQFNFNAFRNSTLAQESFANKGLKVILNIAINQDANIFLNTKISSQMTGNIAATGDGNLRLEVLENGDFNMYGSYFINDGNFDFNISNIASRRFKIQDGSSLTWTGAAEKAIIDLSGIYTTKASLTALFPDESSVLSLDEKRFRYQTQVVIQLANSLIQPDVSFKINLAGANQNVIDAFNSVVNPGDESEVLKQSLSLLATNSFIGTNTGFGSTSTDALTQIASAQINNLIHSMLNQDNLNVDVNYDQEDQLQLSFGVQLFDERLSIDGGINYGITPNALTNTPTGLSGNFNAEWKMTEQFRFKFFNRPNESNPLRSESSNTTGVGLSFGRERNRFSDLFRREPDKRKKQATKKETSPATENKPEESEE